MGKENRKLYVARFEIGTQGNDLQHPEAVLQKASQKGTVAGCASGRGSSEKSGRPASSRSAAAATLAAMPSTD